MRQLVQPPLILADLQTLENAIPRLEKEVKGKKTDKAVLDTALAARAVLEEGRTLFQACLLYTSDAADE